MTISLKPINEALVSILEQSNCLADTVRIELRSALGHVLSSDISAESDVPDYDNSAMDGYAVSTSESDTETEFHVSQTIAAGHPGTALEQQTVARIFTGAPMPDGANAVVMQENTVRTATGVRITQLPRPGENVRLRGHDIAAGSTVLFKGHRLRPQDLGLLSSLGLTELSVRAPLKVALINTGDEVVEPGKALKQGQLYDSNSYLLEGLLESLGHQVIRMGIVNDDPDLTRDVLASAAEQADCLITTGGVSVGDEDHVRQSVESLGRISVWKLAIKPGKPFAYGFVGNTPFFGLPGNPVAVFVTFTQLVRPALMKMQGASEWGSPDYYLPAGFTRNHAGSREEYLRVRVIETERGQKLEAFNDQGSSLMTSLSWADGLAVIPVETVVNEEDLLRYIPFEGLLA